MNLQDQQRGSASILARLKRRIRLRTRLMPLLMPKDVCTLYQEYAQHPEAKHIVSRLDAVIIYHQIRRHRPGHCVELGCGLGTVTAIIAMAMEANGYGRVTSLEQLDWMADLAEELMPDVCKRRVEIVRCDPEVRQYFGEEWGCYQFTPATADVDSVIVDGPAAWADETGDLIKKPAGDLVGLLPYLRPGCRVFIDGRLSTVEGYRRHLGHRFRIRQNRRFHYTVMELMEPV